MAESFASHGLEPEAALDDPGRWLRSARLLDLEDPRLRLRAHALTQLCKTDREKALAVYGFVKRIPFAKPFKLRLRTARQVVDAGRGDANDKATMLIALLRAAGIPARLRYVELRGEILRGLTSRMASAIRPVAEIWLNGRWLRTDTYIFDVEYMAAARQRLKDRNWEWGYGIHRNGSMIWSGSQDAFLGSFAISEDPMLLADLGLHHDPLEFSNSPAWPSAYSRLARALQWNLRAPAIERVARELRAEAWSRSGSAAARRKS